MYDIIASIVTFKNDRNNLRKTIDNFLDTNLNIRLYVVDNSPTKDLQDICSRTNIEYSFNNNNIGFGAGHNIAIRNMIGRTKYSLILNPDVYFNKGTLEILFNFMEGNKNVGSVMPKVLFPDNSLQYLCRLLPNPFDMVIRKFNIKLLSMWFNSIFKYELRFADYAKTMNIPYLSGCFMFARTEIFKEAGIFDERFFMYFEDVDLSRRIHRLYRTVYYPEAAIYHNYERGSNKDVILLKHLISSGVKYFNKWGWFFDKERKLVNKQTLEHLYSA